MNLQIFGYLFDVESI